MISSMVNIQPEERLASASELNLSRKQGNACGGKGLAGGERYYGRETLPLLRDGQGMSTKLASITLRAGEDPECKFISLAHLLSKDFLKECFGELKRDKAPGIDGVTAREYDENFQMDKQVRPEKKL